MNKNTYNSPSTDSKRSGHLLLVDHLHLSPLYSKVIKVLQLLAPISIQVFSTLAHSLFVTHSALCAKIQSSNLWLLT